jgi:hypothetical protein
MGVDEFDICLLPSGPLDDVRIEVLARAVLRCLEDDAVSDNSTTAAPKPPWSGIRRVILMGSPGASSMERPAQADSDPVALYFA